MSLVGYGIFKLEGGRLFIKFMGTYPVFDFGTWEVEVGNGNIIEVLREKLNGDVVIQERTETEGIFGVYC
jgi:hypothetical protein